jgi:hypothetical protein
MRFKRRSDSPLKKKARVFWGYPYVSYKRPDTILYKLSGSGAWQNLTRQGMPQDGAESRFGGSVVGDGQKYQAERNRIAAAKTRRRTTSAARSVIHWCP